MTNYQSIVTQRLGSEHKRDKQSKTNQIFNLREVIIKSVIAYAQKNSLTETQFEVVFDDSLSILEDLFSAYEPYREKTGDCGDFWSHQYINPKKYLSEPTLRNKPPASANGLFDDYVERYIQQPAMHNRYLTSLLLDTYLYNDTIVFLNGLKENWYSRNLINPSYKFLISKILIQLAGYALAVFLGFIIHSESPELLTPYVLILIYNRYKALKSEHSTERLKEIYNYSMETYTHSAANYQYQQMTTVLKHSHEKYGIRYKSTIYELVELLQQPWS
jgi:hypothetical protein